MRRLATLRHVARPASVNIALLLSCTRAYRRRDKNITTFANPAAMRPDPAARPRFPWFLTLSFVLCVAIFAAAAASFLANMRALSASAAEIARSDAAVRALYALQAQLLSADAGFRGFVLTGRAEFLEPFHHARNEHDKDLKRAAAVLAPGGAQQRRLSALRDETGRLFAHLQEVITLREEKGIETAATVVGANKGKDQMIRALALVKELREHEEGLSALHAQESGSGTSTTVLTTLSSSALAIVALTLFYILTRKFFLQRGASEHALRARESEFRALFDMAAVGMVECVASSGSIVRVNARFCDLLGYPAAELDRTIFFQLLHAADGGADRSDYDRMLRKETREWVAEKRCMKRDGMPIWVRLSFGLILDAGGAPHRTVGIIEDIDERKRMESELRDSAAVLSTVSGEAPDLVYVKDTAGRLVKANRAMERLFGQPRAALLGKNELDLLDDPADAKRVRETDCRIMQGARTERIEESMRINGRAHTFLSTKVPRYDAERNVIGLIGISRDITDRKQAEDMLRQDHDVLAAAVRARTAELAELSRHLITVSEEEKARLARELHDEMGSSLAAISMDMGWILKKLRQTHPELAERQARALAGIHATLDLKRRIVEGLRPLALEHFGLETALRAHCDAFAESTRLAVDVHLQEGLPELDAVSNLTLFRVAQECMTNVARHARATRVTLHVHHDEGSVRARIEDDGIGIPSDVMSRPGAHGILGMRERVSKLGGTLSVRCGDAGKGTAVEAVLPLAPVPAAGDANRTAHAPAGRPSPDVATPAL